MERRMAILANPAGGEGPEDENWGNVCREPVLNAPSASKSVRTGTVGSCE